MIAEPVVIENRAKLAAEFERGEVYRDRRDAARERVLDRFDLTFEGGASSDTEATSAVEEAGVGSSTISQPRARYFETTFSLTRSIWPPRRFICTMSVRIIRVPRS